MLVVRNISFDVKTYLLLKKLSEKTGRSASSIVRESVQEWAKAHGVVEGDCNAQNP